MRKVVISEPAHQDLKYHLAFIVDRDGIDRAIKINDQIIDKIYEIARLPIQVGQSKNAYLPGLKRSLFKGVYIYYTYEPGIFKVERIISRFRNQGNQFG